jgi:hypothetical protein
MFALRTLLDYNTKMTKKDVSIVTVVQEEKVLKVTELLFSGMSKTEACAQAGISQWTFDRYVAQSPELIRMIQSSIRANFSALADGIVSNKRKNIEVFTQESDRIRETLESGVLDEDERAKAISSLLKIDGHLGKTIDFIYPIIKEPADEKPTDNSSDAKAMEILASVKGAKLTMVQTRTVTIEKEKQLDVIDGKTVES